MENTTIEYVGENNSHLLKIVATLGEGGGHQATKYFVIASTSGIKPVQAGEMKASCNVNVMIDPTQLEKVNFQKLNIQLAPDKEKAFMETNNYTWRIKGGKLTILVDLTRNLGSSTSGKNIILAKSPASGGPAQLGDTPFKLHLVIYTNQFFDLAD